jgi:hypothetical protein
LLVVRRLLALVGFSFRRIDLIMNLLAIGAGVPILLKP